MISAKCLFAALKSSEPALMKPAPAPLKAPALPAAFPAASNGADQPCPPLPCRRPLTATRGAIAALTASLAAFAFLSPASAATDDVGWETLTPTIKTLPAPANPPAWLGLAQKGWWPEIVAHDGGPGAFIAGGIVRNGPDAARRTVIVGVLQQGPFVCDAGANSASSTQNWSLCPTRVVFQSERGKLALLRLEAPGACIYSGNLPNESFGQFRVVGETIEFRFYSFFSQIAGCDQKYNLRTGKKVQ